MGRRELAKEGRKDGSKKGRKRAKRVINDENLKLMATEARESRLMGLLYFAFSPISLSRAITDVNCPIRFGNQKIISLNPKHNQTKQKII